MTKLNNPVWHSLCETHKHYLIEFNDVKFYNPDICAFGAFLDLKNTKSALNHYAELTNKFFLVTENQTPSFDENKIELIKKMEGCQMVLQKPISVEISEEIIPLTSEYIDEIYDLIWLVMPDFYRKGGFKMGDYYGIVKNNKLVSIAGMRMQTNDFIELSGIVTHPDHTRNGYAKQLSYYVTQKIIDKNKRPILHTTKGNSAIKLYEKLGYKLTRDMNWWYFQKKQ